MKYPPDDENIVNSKLIIKYLENNEEDLIRYKNQDKNGQVLTLLFHCHQVYSCLGYSEPFCLSLCRTIEEPCKEQHHGRKCKDQ